MTTPQSPQGGWTPGPQNFPHQSPGWAMGTPQPPMRDSSPLGIPPEAAVAQENELQKEQAELSKRNAVRWMKISTALAASALVVIGMLAGWQQLFWLQLFTDSNSYVENSEGKELINEDLLNLLNRDSGSDSETQNSTGSTVGGVDSGEAAKSSDVVSSS